MAIFRLVDEGLRYNHPTLMNFSNWPEWLKVLVLVPHVFLACVACWLWWPKSNYYEIACNVDGDHRG